MNYRQLLLLAVILGVLSMATAACAGAAPTATTEPLSVPTVAPTEPPPASATIPATATVTTAPDTPTTEPTATATTRPVARAADVSLSTDASEVAAGSCTTVHWTLAGATEITLQGQPVAASGAQQVCPSETTVYTLTWTNADGTKGSREITVAVEASQQANAQDEDKDDKDKKADARPAEPPTAAPSGPPTATDCGDECDPWNPPPVVTEPPAPGPTTEEPQPTKEPNP